MQVIKNSILFTDKPNPFIECSSADTTFIGYWGIDSMYLLGRYPTFAYTLLLSDPTVACTSPVGRLLGTQQIDKHLQVSFHPNPVEDMGVLNISDDAATEATIEIEDQQGRMIVKVFSGEIHTGSSEYPVNTKALSPGLYFLVINSSEGNKTLKFTKL